MAIAPDPTAEIIAALGHPLRREVIALYMKSEDPLSPSEIGDILDRPLSNVAYHVRLLFEDYGVLAHVDQKPRRGSTEHYYALSPFARSSDMLRFAVDGIEVPDPLPTPREAPTRETFERFANQVLTPGEQKVVRYRKGWGRGQRSRQEVAETVGISAEKIRQMERRALYRIERAKFEADREEEQRIIE